MSYYEADAYARWSGFRLPTEAEWEIGSPGRGAERELPRKRAVPSSRGERRHGTCEVVRRRLGMDAESLYGLSGDATGSRALGEYNAKFMCNQLVLRGGSCATPASHIRATYRNFFPPEARWQFSGIRLARS